MDFNLPPIGGADPSAGRVPASRAPDGKKDFSKVVARESDVRLDAVPGTPPAEVHVEVERASTRYDELQAKGREIHFATDQKSGRLVIEVRDLDGKVIRTIPPSTALDVISGTELD
jgi:flagellar protein FlaG